MRFSFPPLIGGAGAFQQGMCPRALGAKARR